MGVGWIWMLLGCPFIFGPPELGPTDRGIVDPDSANTDDTGVRTGSPPEVTFEIETTFDAIDLLLVLEDPDGDLEGGVLQWSTSTESSSPIRIPDDLASWNVLTGEARVTLDEGVPTDCTSDSIGRVYEVTVTDAAGNRSAVATQPFAFTVFDVGSPSGGRRNLGEVAAPALLCAALLPSDDDNRWNLQHRPGGLWEIRLAYTGSPMALRIGGIPGGPRFLDDTTTTTQADLVDGQPYNFDADRIDQASSEPIELQVWFLQ